ncbi:MAG TPA: hypothetical protein VF488_05505 [Gemmatimonadaceae bacterium]
MKRTSASVKGWRTLSALALAMAALSPGSPVGGWGEGRAAPREALVQAAIANAASSAAVIRRAVHEVIPIVLLGVRLEPSPVKLCSSDGKYKDVEGW